MPVIAGHGRNLPDGRNIAEALQALWRQQAIRFARSGEPESVLPDKQEQASLERFFGALLGPLWRQAWLEALYRIRLSEMNSRREMPLTEVRTYRGMVEISAGIVTKDLRSFAVGFDVYNEEITKYIEQQTYHFLASVNQTTVELLRTALFIGESEGWTLLDKTRAVQGIFHDQNRSLMIAASESSRAAHGGEYEATLKTELADRKRWLNSSDSCKRCMALGRMGPIPIEKPFDVTGSGPYSVTMFPPVHPNCVLPGNLIVAPAGLAAIEAQYDGPVVSIDFVDGCNVTVTPQHMLLTPHGFITAAGLVEGDNVIRYIGRYRPFGPNDDGKPADVQKVVHAWSKSFGMTRSHMPVSAKNLHGDGARCHGNIDIVNPYCLLRRSLKAAFPKPANQNSLALASGLSSCLNSQSDLATMLFALLDATNGVVGGLRDRLANFRAASLMADEHCFTQATTLDPHFLKTAFDERARHAHVERDSLLGIPSKISSSDFLNVNRYSCGKANGLFEGPDGNSGSYKTLADHVAANSIRLADCLARFTSQIATSQIRDIKVTHYAGPVYDFQDVTTMYILGNGIVSSNCMCTVIYLLAGMTYAA